MSEDLLKVFDAWEPLIKARKAKGLDQWSRLSNLAGKLQGKGADAISFTCAHPNHAGQAVKHYLGSVEGNLHFLMGYGNPGFHMAPYHWMVMDPSLTEEQAEEMNKRMGHMSNPALWANAGIEAGEEGDLQEGQAHSKAREVKIAKQKKEEEVKGISPTGSYTCTPSDGLVVNDKTGHTYSWELVKDTFFSAQNPKVTEAMSAVEVSKGMLGVRYKSTAPDAARLLAKSFTGTSFDPTVWPLIKSRMNPGTLFTFDLDGGETYYGVVTDRAICFFNREATPVSVSIFDRVYKSLDLVRDGSVPPSSLFTFITKYFKVNTAVLADVSNDEYKLEKGLPSVVYGEPSPGFEDVSSEYQAEELSKSLVIDGDTIRVVREHS